MKYTAPILLALAAAGTVCVAEAQNAAGQPAGDSQLARSGDWQRIAAFWQAAQPLATTHKSTTAQREKFDKDRLLAEGSARKLQKEGTITPQEADLLVGEFARLRGEILRDPPTDSRVMCYDMAFMPPAQASLARLAAQADLLEKQVKTRKLDAKIAEVLRPAMLADLEVVSDQKLVAQLSPEAQKQAADVAQRIRKVLATMDDTTKSK